MNKNLKNLKLIIPILILITMLLTSTQTFARVFAPKGNIWFDENNKTYVITDREGNKHIYFCARAGARLFPNGDEYFEIIEPGYLVGYSSDPYVNTSKNLGEALGFGMVFNYSNSNLANAFWRYGHTSISGHRGADTSLEDLVEAYNNFYANYVNVNNKLNTSSSSESAKTMVNNQNIVVGPMQSYWHEEIVQDIPFSWLYDVEIQYCNTQDDSTNENSWKTFDEGDAKITDVNGTEQTYKTYEENKKITDTDSQKEINAPTSGVDYYVSYTYKTKYENIDKIRVKLLLKYISGAEGYATEYDTKIVKEDNTDTTVNDNTQEMVERGEDTITKGDSWYYAGSIHGKINYDITTLVVDSGPIGSNMEIAGSVWRDEESGKDQKTDGKYSKDIDNLLNGIEVYLYEEINGLLGDINGDGTIDNQDINILSRYFDGLENLDEQQQIRADVNNNGVIDNPDVILLTRYLVKLAEIETTIIDGRFYRLARLNPNLGIEKSYLANPQITRRMINSDTNEIEDGRYSFKGMDPTKKYIIVFKYDGMLYTNTYGAGEPAYNSDEWVASSKGSELVNERNSLNYKFTTINSYGDSYLTTSLFNGEQYYNKVYNLRGEKVQEYKKYIREKMTEYMNNGQSDYVLQVYKDVYNQHQNDSEARSVLQFIWDCKINAYAGSYSVQDGIESLTDMKTYPYYDKFILTNRGILFKYGDIDGDSNVNKNDITILERYLRGTVALNEKQQESADVNRDGNINEYDLSYLRYCLGEKDGSYSLPETMYGDVDGNGIVSIEDVKYLNEILDYKEIYKENTQISIEGDMDGNGVIDEEDLNYLKAVIDNQIERPSIRYGDVNRDGEIDNVDMIIISRYMSGATELTEQQKFIADIDHDGKVNSTDIMYINQYNAGNSQNHLNEVYYIGDVNGDGELNEEDYAYLQSSLKGLNEQQQKNADVDHDGDVDYDDLEYLRNFINGVNGYTLTVFGDIDQDGDIDYNDVTLLNKYINGSATLSEQQRLNADVNEDGNIDTTDLTILTYVVNEKTYNKYNGLGEKYDTLGRATATEVSLEDGYYYIYRGQLYINLGLVERPSTQLDLTQDLVQSVLSVNGKDETYNYNKLITEDNKKVEVLRTEFQATTKKLIGDSVSYIAKDDYSYSTSGTLSSTAIYDNNTEPIQIYSKYRIIVKNNSGVATKLNEVVTYFDRHYYSFSNEYTTTSGAQIAGITAKYYNNVSDEFREIDTDASDSSAYPGTGTEASLKGVNNSSITGINDMIDLYIRFGEDAPILQNNDYIAIYLTLRIGENSTYDSKYNCTYQNNNSARYILENELKDDTSQISANSISEINSYSTYKKDRDGEATQEKYRNYYINDYRPGGFLDLYSIPGNLDSTQVNARNNQTEKVQNTWVTVIDGIETGNVGGNEYDWDQAPSFIISRNIGDNDGDRVMRGNVWETTEEATAYINSRTYPTIDSDNNGSAEKITVELVEIKNGQEYVRATALTDSNGKYEISKYIPGDYVVRFVYGNNDAASKNRKFNIENEEFEMPYNGQFYQSAKANPNTDNTKYWYVENVDTRLSDAYDEINSRGYVNALYNKTSNPYYTYRDEAHTIISPNEYKVYAYTSLMNIEFEKAKTESSTFDPGYSIENIDFALTPRTSTKLEISKEVSNIKLVLQNGVVKFDATTEALKNGQVEGVTLLGEEGPNGTFNIQMSDELINGATIEITYKITVKNNSEYDSVTYYKDRTGRVIAIALYEEGLNSLVYYETENGNGNIRFYINDENPYREDTNYKVGETNLISAEGVTRDVVETTTSPRFVADFVANNLEFKKTSYTGKEINKGWEIYKADDKANLVEEYYKLHAVDQGNGKGLQDMNSAEVYNHTNIVYATGDNPLVSKNLKHREESSSEIVLSKVISASKLGADTKNYDNYVRILGINNNVSKVQDLVVDTAESERVTIAVGTGTKINYEIITLTLLVITIIATGIVLIKKYVLPSR